MNGVGVIIEKWYTLIPLCRKIAAVNSEKLSHILLIWHASYLLSRPFTVMPCISANNNSPLFGILEFFKDELTKTLKRNYISYHAGPIVS